MNEPGSSPDTTRLRLASAIICRDIRSAIGPSHSEHSATTTTTGSTSARTGRSSCFGPMPTEVITGISESRYSRPMPSIMPSSRASGRISGSQLSSTSPSCENISPAGRRPLAMSFSTSVITPPTLTISNTTRAAKVDWASSPSR